MEGGKKDERGIAEKRRWLSTEGRIRGKIQILVKSFVDTVNFGLPVRMSYVA